jgi:hypothetical protein
MALAAPVTPIADLGRDTEAGDFRVLLSGWWTPVLVRKVRSVRHMEAEKLAFLLLLPWTLLACSSEPGVQIDGDDDSGVARDSGIARDSGGNNGGGSDSGIAKDSGDSGGNHDGCVATTCAAAGKNCGSLADGCGKTLNCGSCTVAGQSCGGSGIPNVCGVTGQCANQPPANAMSIRAGVKTTFTAAGFTNWVIVPQSYDTVCHGQPKKLFVWQHGCSGSSEWDVEMVQPKGADDWIAMTIGAEETGSACWKSSDESIILSVIDDIQTRLAIDPKQIIIGGYSSGGDVSYLTIFHNSKRFAMGLFENTAPPSNMTAALAAAAPPGGWRFPIAHLCHTQDTTYPCATVQSRLASATGAGHAVSYFEMDGGHWEDDVNGRGTWPDFDAKLRPFLNETHLAP